MRWVKEAGEFVFLTLFSVSLTLSAPLFRSPVYQVGSGPWTVAKGDFNGDGRADLVTANVWSDDVSVLLSIGELQFAPESRIETGLSPYALAVADFDGDGNIEIAYIDRPHLAKTLRIWRFNKGKLQYVADHPGLTNHKIGWDHIPGGIRDCGTKPEIVSANADWTRIVATSLKDGRTITRDLGLYRGPDSLNAALSCS